MITCNSNSSKMFLWRLYIFYCKIYHFSNFFKNFLYLKKSKKTLILGKMKNHYHSFKYLITLKACRIIKFSCSKRAKNDWSLHNNFMFFWYYEFWFYDFSKFVKKLPRSKKPKSKFSIWRGPDLTLSMDIFHNFWHI